MSNILEAKMSKPRASATSYSVVPRYDKTKLRDELRQCYSMSEFAAATQNFSNYNILYNGIYTIYIGAHLSSTKPSLSSSSSSSSSSYIIYRGIYLPNDSSKLKHISLLSHPNLASMLGYSCSDHETVVGYKNEGARLLLHQLSHSKISWLERLNICIGVAEALRCIHTARIIHGGISPTTILLDNSSSAKLVTFGSVLGQVSVYDARRPDLLPPDILGFSSSTEKTDVFLFGLLLLIVFCGKKTDYSEGYPFRLPLKVYEAIKNRTLYQITDLSLAKVGERCLNKFLEVAFHCLRPEQVDRASMDVVVEGLNRAQALQMRRQ